jgi:hypothetical protein
MRFELVDGSEVETEPGEKLKIGYFKDHHGRRYTTFVTLREPGVDLVQWGASHCNHAAGDTFSKKRGRSIAILRLLAQKGKNAGTCYEEEIRKKVAGFKFLESLYDENEEQKGRPAKAVCEASEHRAG